ncbi:MAG: penicillin-insensitive murein endopeptidase [Deltaproteobacteria bacterium]|nr:penicillin-insensitive murein endopeptidase [Deltaproteobacteria bacterium]
MRLVSLACVPFFFLPLDTRQVAPLIEEVVEAEPESETVPVRRQLAEASEPPTHRAAPSGCSAPPAPGESQSIGRPTRGELTKGRFLRESELIHHVDSDECNYWGTDELVGAIRRAAAAVAAEHPGHRLTVGELSQRGGGDIRGHASHENGRDVDFGFYFVDEEGLPFEPSRFVDVRRDRTAHVGGHELTFDVERNWRLIEALLTDEEADLNIIVVSGRIRDWLLAHARSIGVPDALYQHASRVLLRPRRGRHPHRNHFHARIYCPPSDAECRDRGRVWDWVEQARAARAERLEGPSEAATP